MFNFQHSQVTQKKTEKLAEWLLKNPMDYAKVISPLHLTLKPDAVFKKHYASKAAVHLQDKFKRLLDILEQYENISPINKKEQPKGNTFINPVTTLAKGESLKKDEYHPPQKENHR